MTFNSTYTEIGSRKPIAGGHGRGGSCMGIVGVDVSQQGAHHCWHSSAQVLGGEAVEVTGIK